MSWLTLVRHVMRVDARAQRWMLAVWGLVLLAQAVVFAAGPERLAAYEARSNYDFGVQVVRLGWTIIMAALFVQSDCLVGTTAFWMTRPIPRTVLLTAKLVSLAIWIIVVPIVVMAGVLLGLGMRPIDALLGGGVIGLEQAVMAVMAVMAALVTANIGQFVVAGIAGVTLVSVFNLLLLPVMMLAWPSVGDMLGGGQPALYAAVVIAGGLAVTAYHYFALRIWRTAALIAGVMLLATGLTRQWPAQAAEQALDPVAESVLSTGGVSLEAAPFRARIDEVARVLPGGREVLKRIEIATTTSGQPPEIYFWPVSARTEFRSATHQASQWSGPASLVPGDRRSIPSTPPAGRGSVEAEVDQPWRSLQIALGDVHMNTPSRLRVYFTPVATIPETQFKSLASGPVHLKSDITMIAYQYVVVASAPLKPDTGFSAVGRAVRIVSVTGVESHLQVELLETFLDRQPTFAQGDFGARRYALRNMGKRQAELLAWKERDSFAATTGIAATRVMTARGTLGMESGLVSSGHIRVDAEWLAGAELVILEPKPLGVLTRTLVIENLNLGGIPDEQDPRSKNQEKGSTGTAR